MVRLLQKIFTHVKNLGLQSIKEGNTFVQDYIRGAQIIVFNDVSPEGTRHYNVKDFAKMYIGRDTMMAQKKHSNFYQRSSPGFFYFC